MTSPKIMGIVNVTPDSFSGDGLLLYADYIDRAVDRAQRMVADGARILDIGGESSRPGSISVSTDEEIRRVEPVVRAIKKKLPKIAISVDTVKADVAERALKAGATIVNDISALKQDPRMGEVAARNGAKVVLMHNRVSEEAYNQDETLGGSFDSPGYADMVAEVEADLKERIQSAQASGIKRDKIILDPGIGFGKTPQENLVLVSRLKNLKELGFPILVGLSRKSFIGHVLDAPIADRIEGTAACTAIAVMQGADILRVHDVKFMSRVVKMATAIRDAKA
ncbi:MAG: dihydropteroate synthase [Alphaproteobacteria bacterium]|nr:dihydropteroate synthase [Alphaproteobacteria bacterium]